MKKLFLLNTKWPSLRWVKTLYVSLPGMLCHGQGFQVINALAYLTRAFIRKILVLATVRKKV
jgi:hypothetical protein